MTSPQHSQPDIHELKSRLDKAEWVLNNSGFRRCDIPACNCGSWHQVGGFYERFKEIQEVVEEAGYSTNGRVLLDVVKEIVASATARCSKGTEQRNPLAAEYELATPPHYRPDAADEEDCPPRSDAVSEEERR